MPVAHYRGMSPIAGFVMLYTSFADATVTVEAPVEATSPIDSTSMPNFVLNLRHPPRKPRRIFSPVVSIY